MSPKQHLQLPICSGCGANIPSQTQYRDCDFCHTPFADPPLTVGPPQNGWQLVQVRAGFACRSCGFLSPLGGLVQNHSVTCRQCGLTQRMYDEWSEILEQIHSTADLAGPLAALRDENEEVARLRQAEYQNTCITRPNTEITFDNMGTRQIQVAASPGHPVCARCSVPLELAIDGNQTRARCPRCGEEQRYAIPPDCTPKKGTLVGVISLEQRLDVEQVSAKDGRVTSLKCPSCGASLPASEGQKSVVCEYCGSTALVPSSRSAPDPTLRPDSEPFWLIFCGVSPKRAQMESYACISAMGEELARKRRDRAAESALLAQARQAKEERQQQMRQTLKWSVIIAGAAALLLGLAVFVFF